MKDSSPKLNSIDWCASAQGFSSRPAFFENAKRLQTAPDQEIQLPVGERYLIIILDVCKNALVKDSSPKLNSIDWCASAQGFFNLLVFGGAFSLVFSGFLLVIQKISLRLLMEIKAKTKSWTWERFAH